MSRDSKPVSLYPLSVEDVLSRAGAYPAAAQDSEARRGEAAREEHQEEAETNMKPLLWIIAIAACVVAVSWPKLATPALAVALVCGLIGLGYLVMRRGLAGPTDHQGGDPRDGGSLPQPSNQPDVEFRDRGQRFGPS